MNLTKKRKLIAIVMSAVMCLAIVVTASIIFAPNSYKSSDVKVNAVSVYDSYEQGGYGMVQDVKYTNNNTAVAYIENVESGYTQILYPTEIYIDKNENLKDLYSFIVSSYYPSDAKETGHVYFMNTFGYYNSLPKSVSYNSNYNTLMRVFDYNVGINEGEYKALENFYHVSNNTDGCEGDTANDRIDNKILTIKQNDHKKASVISFPLMGSPQTTPAATDEKQYYTYESTSGIALNYMIYNNWVGTRNVTSNSIKKAFTSKSGDVTINQIKTSYSTGMNIKIYTYDKAPLFTALKNWEKKYDALDAAKLLLTNFDYEEIKTRAKTCLSTREVTSKTVIELTNELNNYTFKTCIPIPEIGSEEDPKQVNYTGSVSGISAVWQDYSNNIPNTNTKYSDCFRSVSVNHSLTSFESAVGQNVTILNAGYYTAVFAPYAEDKTINVNGFGNIKVRFCWDDESTGEQTGYLYVNPAEIEFSGGSTTVAMAYNGNTPNKLRSLNGELMPNGVRITLKQPNGSGLPANTSQNVAQLQLSLESRADNIYAWAQVAAGNELQFADVTDAPVEVFYRLSANNHADEYGRFTVSVNPANIRLNLNRFNQTYHSQLLNSDEIFDMLDENVRVLDAITFEETKDYLKNILTFAIMNNDGEYFAPTDTPSVGSYTVAAIKTSADPWAKRIANITFTSDSNRNCYQITPKPIEVNWIDNSNKWYDARDSHRPSAKVADGQETYGEQVGLEVSIDGGEAVNAGEYTARVASQNANYTVSNNTHTVTVLARKISIEIKDRQRRYAQSMTADELVEQYQKSVLLNNNNQEGYVATLDSEIVSATGQTNALVHNDYRDVFTVNVVGERTQDNSYFIVNSDGGFHTLEVKPENINYEFTGITNGKFTVTPAQLITDVEQLPPMLYSGDQQEMVLKITTGADGNTDVYGYELAHPETIKVEYSLTGADNSWTANPFTIKDVKDSPKIVYYKVSAPNHIDYVNQFKQEMGALGVMFTFSGQTAPVYYGDEIPNSQTLYNKCGGGFKLFEKASDGHIIINPDGAKKIDPTTIFEFYLLDPITGQQVVNRNTNAGRYTVTARLKTSVDEDINNFDVSYENRNNIEVYEISKKQLFVDWNQEGKGWSIGESGVKDHYTFGNTVPIIQPIAPNSYNEKENVVSGDIIKLSAGEGEMGSTVKDGGYTVTTKLTTQRNINNYELQNPSHVFYIDKLDVNIIIKDQTATYGQASLVPLGELIDPINAGALWDYAQGSEGRFYSDHYRNWKFISQAHSETGELVDVNEEGYDIGIVANTKEGMDGSIRNNYNVNIVKEGDGKNAKFFIIPAEVRFTGRQFNIDVGSGEDTVITKQMLKDRVSTGVKGIGLDEFEFKMSDRFLQDGGSHDGTWVESTTEVKEIDCDDYYILFSVSHNKGNFKSVTFKIELRVHSDWISVTLDKKGIIAEYGDDIISSEIFKNMKANSVITQIAGFKDDNDKQLWITDPEAAIDLLGSYVRFFVGAGDLVSELDKDKAAIGNYSLFMEKKAGEYQYYRFIARDNESDTSNIDAYHIGPRTVSVSWNMDDMNEIYGDHGGSHTGFVLTNVLEKDVNSVRALIEYSIDTKVENNTASFDGGGHARTVGEYIATITGVTNPNYKIDPNDSNLTTNFTISPKTIEISLHNREFTYGDAAASVANIDDALNTYSQNPNYDFDEKTPFVGNDNRMNIFRIYLASDKGSGDYLSAGTYTIDAEQLDNSTSINYEIIVNKTGTLKINPAQVGLSIKNMTTITFNAQQQKVGINRDWLVVVGDVAYNRENAKISYRTLSRENLKEPDDKEFIPEDQFTVRDSGRYVIEVKLEVPNHKDPTCFEVNLNVTTASVIINMTKQAKKTYGDNFAKLQADARKEGVEVNTLSDWLKHYCGITITLARSGEDITEYALADFEFYVVDPDKLSEDGGDALEIGSYQNDVRESGYRVYHTMAAGAISGNYLPAYYQAEGSSSKCNAHAYMIQPREVDVDWDVEETDKANWNSERTKYYFTSKSPKLIAKFETVVQGEYVYLDINGIENANIGDYVAQVSHSAWNTDSHAKNYKLASDSRKYSIVKRPLTVTINNQNKGAYGEVLGNVSLTQSNGLSGAYTVYDEIARADVDNLPNNPLWLVFDNKGIGADKLLPAGSYAITVDLERDGIGNYEITMVGRDGSDCGWLIVDKAKFNFPNKSTYSNAKYKGVDFTLDFKNILSVDAGDFVAGDDWESAWANATIIYTQNGETVAKPVFSGAGVAEVGYTLQFVNYQDFNGMLEVEVQKGAVKVAFNALVSSVYGDDLLSSKQIFDKNVVDYSGDIEIDLDKVIEFNIMANPNAIGKYNAGRYSIDYSFVGKHADNFEIDITNNFDTYVITARVVEIEWSMDMDDNTLQDGAYVFDGKTHKVNYTVKNVCEGDVITPKVEGHNQKDQANMYTAKLIGIGDNKNYAMPADCTFEWTIKPRAIEVDWTVGDYTYDGTAKIPSAIISDGVIEGTSCGLVVEGAQINAGTYDAIAKATSPNYVISNSAQSFTIKPKQIQVDWENDTFVYDGNAHAPTASIRDGQLVLAGETIEVTVSGAQINAGTYTATVSGLNNSNYEVVGASKSFVINKREVTINWTQTDFDYTGQEVAPVAKLEGVLNGDAADVQIDGGKTNVGTYTATAVGVTNDNYVLAKNAVTEMDFTIYKVDNEFEDLFGIGDNKGEQIGVPWLGSNKPTDKFGGEVIVKYYEDEDCTKEISVDKIKDGTYWAVAFVAGTENYNELVSTPFKFTIDNGINVALAVSGIVISIVLLGAALAVVLIIGNKKKKGGNV